MNLLVWPVLLPLLTAAVLLLVRQRAARNAVAIGGASATLVIELFILRAVLGGEVVVSQMASWPAPYGITLVADGLAALLLTVTGVTALLTTVFTASSLEVAPRPGQGRLLNRAREAFGAQALFQFLFMGVNMSFLTGDLFNLFVAFEVMLIASYGLLLLGGELPQLREGLRYVAINLVSSAVFVVTAGLAYGLFGTLNMADIALRVAEHGADARVTGIAALLALVFATKGALFPLGFWLPNSYPVPAAAVSAFFAAVLTKVGVYALLRSFTLMFAEEAGTQLLILALAGVTVLIGALGALARQRWRHILSFANVASIGYLAIGVFLGTRAGLAAAVYYLINSVLVVFALFLVAALAETIAGPNIHRSGHLRRYPWLGAGFFVGLLALAGMPPTSGFIGKYAVISALLQAGGALAVTVAVSAVLGGILLLYAGIRIWQAFFWGEPSGERRVRLPRGMTVTAGASVVLLLALAAGSGPVYRASQAIAVQLDGNAAYLAAVLPDALPAAPPAEATPPAASPAEVAAPGSGVR